MRFLFLIVVVAVTSCSKIDKLPIDRMEENPVFGVNLNVGGIPFVFEAGLEDYFMFAQADTIGSLRINKGLLAPSSDQHPVLQSALSINFVGQDIRSGETIRPDAGELALFTNDTVPSWEMNVQASLFGEFEHSGMKLQIDGKDFDYSSQANYLIRRKNRNTVKLFRKSGEKTYYYSLINLKESLDNLGQQNLHIYLEGNSENNAKIYVQSNLEDYSPVIVFPDGSKYDFEESIAVNQLGEYKVTATSDRTNTVIETNFFIDKDQHGRLRSSRISFTGSTRYLGMIESLNSAFIEYYDAGGNLYTSVSKATDQPSSSFFRIEKVEVFQSHMSEEPADKVTFSGEVVLTSSDNKTLLFSGSGVIALGK